jgi:D-alanyl-D-alanine carboxypeptidase (penicillin-binding protein 5/6)
MLFSLLVLLPLAMPVFCLAKVVNMSKDPYAGAIVVDAATGQTLFENNADLPAYPASVVKLMDLLIVLEKIDQGFTCLSNTVTATAQISKIGGTQVWLKEHEVCAVEDLLYAMMIRSANDAAAALAIHIAGTTDGFVELMNKKAEQLGMTATRFHSVHGLPPAKGEDPDVTTPRDLVILARELVKRPEVLRYTSTRSRIFRPDAPEGKGRVEMLSHNRLLTEVEGCDGLKTGFFDAAGFSIVATVQRNGRRVIAVVMGSKSRKTRDEEAKKLISKGFLELPPLPPPKPVITNTIPTNSMPVAKKAKIKKPHRKLRWTEVTLTAGVGILIVWAVASFVMRRSRPTDF